MSRNVALSRCHFVKTFALGTVTSVYLGSKWVNSVLADVQLQAVGTTGNLVLHLSDFTALQSISSSIRLALNPFNPTFGSVSPYYPILVNRASVSQFYALSARCSHMGCVVPTFGHPCPCHSSIYNIDGTVLSGPAPAPLTPYSIVFDGTNTLTIQVPNLGFSVASASVQGPPARLQLSFPSIGSLSYEVRFAQTVDQLPAAILFATTPTGAADQSSITGTGSTLSVYVDRTTATGFYVVNVKVTQA